MAQGTPSSVNATPRRFRWRRLVQFSLRTLLIFTALVAFWLEYIANPTAALAQIEEHDNATIVLGHSDRLTDDVIRTVEAVRFIIDEDGASAADDSDMEQLANCAKLTSLIVNCSKITDAGLRQGDCAILGNLA